MEVMMKQYPSKETHYYHHFKEFLTDIAGRYPDRTAITTYLRGTHIQEKSFSELKRDSFAFAGALFGKGLNGKHIAIVSESCYEWLVAYFGIVISGGVAVCIDVEQFDDTLEKMIVQADAEAVVCSAGLFSLCSSIQSRYAPMKEMIVIRPSGDEALSFEQFMEDGTSPENQALVEACDLDPKQTASIVYTSGTTSTAKPVMLSHSAMLFNAADSLTILDSRERIFNSLPLYHTYGFTCGILCGLIRGLNICVSCDMKRMMQEMTLFKPQMLVAVPLIIEVIYKLYWSLLEKAEVKEKVQKQMKIESVLRKPHTLIASCVKEAVKGSCVEQLDVVLSGGAYLDRNVAEGLLHFGAVVLQGYGVTECSPSITCNRNEDFSLDSVGIVLPGNEVKIVDDEIWVKGYALMNGYYKAPELTAESFEDGWFKTGDLGHFDKKGHLHIVGRKKNLIVMKNGKKVAAEEMENKIRECPLVKEVVVYGALSGNSMDDVKIAASIFPDPYLTGQMSSYEVLEHLQEYIDEMNEKLPIYKQIQMINIRETDFDRTAAKKIKRQMI